MLGKSFIMNGLLRRYQTLETGSFSRESLIIIKMRIFQLKNIILIVLNYLMMIKRVLVRTTELPSIAFMRDSNAGNAFLKD